MMWQRPREATSEQVHVELLALAKLAAIRRKDDTQLQAVAVDRIAGWRDDLPRLAAEMREAWAQVTDKPFAMVPVDSRVDGERAVVKCIGPEEFGDGYLVLFFIRTDDGWCNWNMRNSPPHTPLSEHLKLGPDAPPAADAGH
jgi:hypothetical protein